VVKLGKPRGLCIVRSFDVTNGGGFLLLFWVTGRFGGAMFRFPSLF
jgi:hypothetical protein